AGGLAALLFGLGLGRDFDALLLDLLRREFFLGEASQLLLALGNEDGFLGLGLGHLGAALGLGGDLAEQRVRFGDPGAGLVLARHGRGLGGRDADALLLLGLL